MNFINLIGKLLLSKEYSPINMYLIILFVGTCGILSLSISQISLWLLYTSNIILIDVMITSHECECLNRNKSEKCLKISFLNRRGKVLTHVYLIRYCALHMNFSHIKTYLIHAFYLSNLKTSEQKGSEKFWKYDDRKMCLRLQLHRNLTRCYFYVFSI